VSDFDFEPIRGLPEALPPGEQILWQGAPAWKMLANDALHAKKIAVYFGLLIAWRIVAAMADGQSLVDAAVSSIWLLALAAAAVGVLSFLAWLLARTTVYTITNQRLVMRYGVALPMTVNIPFNVVDSVALTTMANGYGGIALSLLGEDRIAYLHLWPHARRWQFARPQPMLRAIPEVEKVGEIISKALVANLGGIARQVADPVSAPARQPAFETRVNQLSPS
jgi:hypothetical protein